MLSKPDRPWQGGPFYSLTQPPVPFPKAPLHNPGHAVCCVAVRSRYMHTASLPRLASNIPGLVRNLINFTRGRGKGLMHGGSQPGPCDGTVFRAPRLPSLLLLSRNNHAKVRPTAKSSNSSPSGFVAGGPDPEEDFDHISPL